MSRGQRRKMPTDQSQEGAGKEKAERQSKTRTEAKSAGRGRKESRATSRQGRSEGAAKRCKSAAAGRGSATTVPKPQQQQQQRQKKKRQQQPTRKKQSKGRGGGSSSNSVSICATADKPETVEAVLSSLQSMPVRELAMENWFHGFLSRVDITEMLTKKGDYLVRTTEPNEGEGFTYVLSIASGDPEPIRHILLRSNRAGEVSAKLSSGRQLKFLSIRHFIHFFMRTKLPVTDASEQTYLKRPVRHQVWELNRERVTLGEKLGEGAFGEVKKGTMLKPTGESSIPVAVKCVSTIANRLTKNQVQEIMQEVRLMRNYKHKNIVRLYGVVAKGEPILIVMELITGSGLDKYLQKFGSKLSQTDLMGFCLDAGYGLEYLHSQSCIHR